MKRKKKIPRAAKLIKKEGISKIKITSPSLHIDLASGRERKNEKRLMRE